MQRETFDEVLKRRDGYTQEEWRKPDRKFWNGLATERMDLTSSTNMDSNRTISKI